MEDQIENNRGAIINRRAPFIAAHLAKYGEGPLSPGQVRLAGHFARTITYKEPRSQSLIADFATPERDPHLAISVDMLDTGIDVPEVVNLAFFKLVRSKTKFFQMLGRGTRLRPDLFGPGWDKEHFNVFDFCQNFEYFNHHPKGIETRPQEPLSQRLFKLRLNLLEACLARPGDPQAAALAQSLANDLHRRVAAMPPDNFIVRPQRKLVTPFAQQARWDSLSKSDLHDLAVHLSGLPTQLPEEPEPAKRFDRLCLNLQLAWLENAPRFSRYRDQVVDLARRLESQTAISAVGAQLEKNKKISVFPSIRC